MKMAIRMVYECASLGLALKIVKCAFFPMHSIKTLGTIVNLTKFTFRLAKSRIVKIRAVMSSLFDSIRTDPNEVPAKLVAAFIGLIW